MYSATPNRPTPSLSRIDFEALPRAYGRPSASGQIRSRAADFIVTENLAFPLSGEGEHLYLRIRKTGQNTRWVAKQLAGRLGLSPRAVGFAGLKDRHAIADQWFSLHLPGKPDPDLNALNIEGVEIIETMRHAAKLRIGALAGNQFRIVVRNLQGRVTDLEARLQKLRDRCVPNYFGPQRFGREGRNLDLLTGPAPDPACGREAKSFGLSALRSALFNGYLAGRIEDQTWDRPLPGEIMRLEATGKFCHVDKLSAGASPAQPTGLLWGLGQNQATGKALEREREYFTRHLDVTAVLGAYGVRMVRRPLGMPVKRLAWTLDRDMLELEFNLTRGQYATAVLHEIVGFTEAMH